MNQVIESFKHLGLLSILLSWTGFAFLLYKWRGKKSKSLSQHAILTKSSYFFFVSIFAVTAPLFYLFVFNWFIPFFNMSKLFVNLIIIELFFQIIYVLIPDKKGFRGILHKLFAYSFAVILVPLNIMIFTSNNVSFIGKFVTLICILYMIFGLLLLIWKRGRLSQYLYFQTAYVLCFHASILVATYF